MALTARHSQSTSELVVANQRTYRIPTRPTVVICIDGFDPAYLEHGLRHGTLPRMETFRHQGFIGFANCSIPSTTNTNNTSIITGAPPAVHGINGNYYLDRETGKEIMVTDARRLRCETILGAMSNAGVQTAVITAKDKLLKVLAFGMRGINFSSEYADRPTIAENGIDNVEALVGRRKPDQYSADLSLFELDAGVRILRNERPRLMYLSTSDYVQHKHAPGEPESDAFHRAIDERIGALIDLGAVVGVTADHGMSDKSRPDGSPNVIYLEDELAARFGEGCVRVICPIADPFVKHHGALGGFVRVHIQKEVDVDAMMNFVRTLPGIELVLDAEEVCTTFDLPPDREGDFAVFSEKHAAVGARREDHDLSQLGGDRLRSHGGLGEQRVPFMISQRLSREYRARAHRELLHNHDIFDFALNGVQ